MEVSTCQRRQRRSSSGVSVRSRETFIAGTLGSAYRVLLAAKSEETLPRGSIVPILSGCRSPRSASSRSSRSPRRRKGSCWNAGPSTSACCAACTVRRSSSTVRTHCVESSTRGSRASSESASRPGSGRRSSRATARSSGRSAASGCSSPSSTAARFSRWDCTPVGRTSSAMRRPIRHDCSTATGTTPRRPTTARRCASTSTASRSGRCRGPARSRRGRTSPASSVRSVGDRSSSRASSTTCASTVRHSPRRRSASCSAPGASRWTGCARRSRPRSIPCTPLG